MNPKDLAKLTSTRIGHLTEVEFKHSVDCSDDYPMYMGELLDAIHTQNDYERIGKALILFLYAHNEMDIEIHEGL